MLPRLRERTGSFAGGWRAGLARPRLIDVRHLQPGKREARLDREHREAAVVLDPVEALLGDRKDRNAIDHETCRRPSMKRVDPEYDRHRWLSVPAHRSVPISLVAADLGRAGTASMRAPARSKVQGGNESCPLDQPVFIEFPWERKRVARAVLLYLSQTSSR